MPSSFSFLLPSPLWLFLPFLASASFFKESHIRHHINPRMNAFAAGNETRCPLVCPKPRRIGQLSGKPDPTRPLRWQSCHQPDPLDLTAGVDLLDIFLAKESPMDSTPPFFYGSPPTRSANPIVNDARFKEAGQLTEILPNPNLRNFAAPAPTSVAARTGCARAKFGLAPAAVRIEGFDCLDPDRNRGCGIPTVA